MLDFSPLTKSTEVEDFDGPLVNPLRAVRLALTPVATQSAVAKRANVSRMVVLRAEQGMYISPPEKIVSALSKFAGFSIDYLELCALYQEWQTSRRVLAEAWLADAWVYDSELMVGPFYQWRSAVAPLKSAMGFCRLLCVHPNALRLYETKQGTATGQMQYTMPGQLVTALNEAGMDDDLFLLLNELQWSWKHGPN